MKMNISGIYKIEDINTGNVYVGSADSDNGIAKRWSCHMAHLRNGEHKYKELQDAFNDNSNRIKWEILEECEDDELERLENYYIGYCDMIEGWTVINKEKKSKRRSKVKDTSKMCKAQTGQRNGNCRLSVGDVKMIKILLKKGCSQTELAKQYNVSPTHINNIYKGKRWGSVKIEEKSASTPIDTLEKIYM